MQRQVRRPPSTFWEDFAEYILGEFKEIAKILGIIFLAMYLFVSMVVGMYTVAVWLFWLLWGLI